VLHIHDVPACEGLTRRRWLQVGGLGLLGLSLTGLLRGGESSRRPIARSCVLFVLHGGPSQLDVWDLKPAAPAEVRGECQPIATTVPGMHICEHLPREIDRWHPGSESFSCRHRRGG
jgi:hypothetical protein